MFKFALNDFNLIATPTDVVIIQGADNVLSQLCRIAFYAEGATAAGNVAVNLVRRSTKFTTQGTATFTAITAGSYDKRQDPAQTQVSIVQTANLTTVGTQVGGLLGSKILSLPIGGSGSIEWEGRWAEEFSPRLTGSSDFIAINLNADTLPAGTIKGYVEVLVEEMSLK